MVLSHIIAINNYTIPGMREREEGNTREEETVCVCVGGGQQNTFHPTQIAQPMTQQVLRVSCSYSCLFV